MPADDVLTPYGPLPTGGAARPMTRWGADVMHRRQQPVTPEQFGTDGLRTLAADMVATMYAADGVGLAACQIGVDLALFVFDCPDASGRHVAGLVCNPSITVPEGDARHLDDDLEGCLSLPGGFAPCPRPDWAAVDGFDLEGEPVHFEGDGLLARCLQHETDHTVGTVFGDRLPTKVRKKLQKAHDKAVEEFPEGWPA